MLAIHCVLNVIRIFCFRAMSEIAAAAAVAVNCPSTEKILRLESDREAVKAERKRLDKLIKKEKKRKTLVARRTKHCTTEELEAALHRARVAEASRT